jgi:hypothetical protein
LREKAFGKETIPQRLKPKSLCRFYGTAETLALQRSCRVFPAGGPVIPRMEGGEYFRVVPGSNRLDSRSAEADTSCCGVNLAFAVFGVDGFFPTL